MCLAMRAVPAWWLEAALTIDPDAWKKKGPLRVATSAMIARKDRIRFMMLLCLLERKQADDTRSHIPAITGGCARNRMGPGDQITGVSVRGKGRQKKTIREAYIGQKPTI